MIHYVLTTLTNSIATAAMREANGLPFSPIITEDNRSKPRRFQRTVRVRTLYTQQAVGAHDSEFIEVSRWLR